MKNTSRRNFLAGLATASAALPLAASTSKSTNLTTPTLDEVKPGIQYALKGYIRRWMYEDDLNQEDLDLIKNDIEILLYPLEMDGVVDEFKVVVSKDENGYVNVKIGLKTEQSVNFKVWELCIVHGDHKWGDDV